MKLNLNDFKKKNEVIAKKSLMSIKGGTETPKPKGYLVIVIKDVIIS